MLSLSLSCDRADTARACPDTARADNNVLRVFSANAFLILQCVKYKLGKLPASGLKWQELDNDKDFEKDSKGAIKTNDDGSKRFKAGMFVLIEADALAVALRERVSFEQAEFDQFEVVTPWSFLSMDCVVKTSEGKYFKPSDLLAPDDASLGFEFAPLARTKYATTIHVRVGEAALPHGHRTTRTAQNVHDCVRRRSTRV